MLSLKYSLPVISILIFSASQAQAVRCASFFGNSPTLLEKYFDVASLQPLISNKQAIVGKDGYLAIDVPIDNKGLITGEYINARKVKFENNGAFESTDFLIPLSDLISNGDPKKITISNISGEKIVVESSGPRADFKGYRIVYTLKPLNGRLFRMKTAMQTNEALYINKGRSIEVNSAKNGIFYLTPWINETIIDFQRTSKNKFIIYTADGYWTKFALKFDQNGNLVSMNPEFTNTNPAFETFFSKVQRIEKM